MSAGCRGGPDRRTSPCHLTTSLLIRDVRPLGGGSTDIRIQDGRIAELGTNLAASEETVIDGGGRLVFPGFVDAHAHIDKTLLGLGWYRNEVGPTLLDKIENERALRRERGIDSHEQSGRIARLMIAAGTTHIRTFVDIDTEIGLSGFEGVLRTRDDLRDALDIQIVAFPQSGHAGPARHGRADGGGAARTGRTWSAASTRRAIDRDPARHLDVIFGLAEKHDADVDIHLHEPGDLGAFSIELIAERTKALGWQGRVVISHALCLGGVEDGYLDRLIELLLENDIAIMSHGPSGLRPVPSVMRLRQAGVRMCTGNDGIRDAWGPLNMPDMLLRTFIIAYRNNLRRDDEIEEVLDIATHGGAQVMGDQPYGLAPGCRADSSWSPARRTSKRSSSDRRMAGGEGREGRRARRRVRWRVSS